MRFSMISPRDCIDCTEYYTFVNSQGFAKTDEKVDEMRKIGRFLSQKRPAATMKNSNTFGGMVIFHQLLQPKKHHSCGKTPNPAP